MNKQLASLSLLVAAMLASLPALAATNAIVKTEAARQITVLSDGSGMPAATSIWSGFHRFSVRCSYKNQNPNQHRIHYRGIPCCND